MANNQIRKPQFSRVLSDTESILRSTDIGPLESLMHKYMASGLTQSAREQNAFNAREAEEAYNRQVDFYDSRQSAPAMVDQYKQAGLNPALVAGYTPSSPPSSDAASGNGGNPSGDVLGLLVNLVMRNKELAIQNKLADAEVDLKNAQADESRSRKTGVDIDNITREEFNNLRNQSITENMHLMQAQANSADAKAGLDLAMAALYSVDYKTRSELNDLRINILQQQVEFNEYQNQSAKFEVEKQAEAYMVNLKNIIAQTSLANAHAHQIKEYAKTMLDSPYIDAKGKEHLNRLAAMTDEEITNLRKNNKAKWVTNYLSPLAGAAALSAGAAAGLIKVLGGPAKAAAGLMTAPLNYVERIDPNLQFGTFDVNM